MAVKGFWGPGCDVIREGELRPGASAIPPHAHLMVQVFRGRKYTAFEQQSFTDTKKN